MNWLKDERTQSWSYMTTMKVRDYITLAEEAHSDRGGIAGQREPLKTTTGRRIRERMLDDLINGTVLPPLVVGIVLDKEMFATLPLKENENILEKFPDKALESLSIIDGMQRTTALLDAVEKEPSVYDRELRIDFWISESVQSLVYRMIVLNTGQVPWAMARQLSVVYRSLIAEIEKTVPNISTIMTPDKPGRRTNPAEYSSEALIEMYLSYSSRKNKIDAKQAVSEQFAKLDFVENLSTETFQQSFYKVLYALVELDIEFSRFTSDGQERFSKGKNIFKTHPARIGFVVAAGKKILGRPGINSPSKDQDDRLKHFSEGMEKLTSHMAGMDDSMLADFLCLETLEEVLSVKSGKVGEYEREVFREAFSVVFEEFENLPSMEPCWRAN